MELLNLLPLAALAWMVFVAIKSGRKLDRTDHYFQENKHLTGKKFHNWFGIPKS
ncbi:MAG: hypothetical protein HQL63_16150 [Magnetococcales bacterium]|nr:hypothetical protein [Magnetococcales bacterium]MBF0322642.1 hypothetical protein [Magnetococcales bacterium]